MKMKDPGTSLCLLQLLFMLVLPTSLATSTGTSSFWRWKAKIDLKKETAQIPYTEIPDLSEFTACLDVFYENDAASTAFSYCVQNSSTLDLGFRRDMRKQLEVFHLGRVHVTNISLDQNVWHIVCLKWKSQTKHLEVYVNRTKIYNEATEDRKLKGNGSLVLGAKHSNMGGQITIIDGTCIIGQLYNYQMWNYTRSQDELLDCAEGNLISWTKEPWKFANTVQDMQLRCANATMTPTPTASSTTQTTILDPQVVSTTSTPNMSTQPDKTSEPMNGTTPRVVGTFPTTKSITPSKVTNLSSPFSSSSSFTSKSSLETYSSPSSVITSSSTSTTPHTTFSGVTDSPLSPSGTTYITCASSIKPNKVTFYFVQITFTIQSTHLIDEAMAASLIQSKMNQLLNNTEFTVVQVIVSDKVRPAGYIAKSIVRANSSGDAEFLADQLGNLLMEGLTDPQLSLIVHNVTTDPLAAVPCSGESTTYDGFPYEWPKTSATEKATLRCHTNPNEKATRDCYINITTLETEWGYPNYRKCIPSTFEELKNIPVTAENANYLAQQILNMIKKADFLSENYISIILNKLEETIAFGKMDLENAQLHMDILNFILIKDNQPLHQFTNKMLNLIEEIGFKMNFPTDTANVTTNSMALLVSKTFKEVYFTVTSYLEGNMEITLEQIPPKKAVAFIHLPKSIQAQAEISSSKVQFNFIGTLSLFKELKSSNLLLNTYVISASIEGRKIKNLVEPINITLWHIQKNVENFLVKCAFWDFSKNNNLGDWDTSGCSKTFTNKEYTSCSCTHLTHFGVLLDISRTPIDPLNEYILSLITYVGCGIASLFLGVALVTYGMFKQLRKDYPSKILMNLTFSMLMLNLLFLINNWLSSFRSQGLCISVAVLLHYFLLTSFTWMGLEAVHMYFAFVKVFNSYIHKYILKLCIVGWGIPLAIVVTVLCININFYGSRVDDKQHDIPGDNADLFCWIQNDIVFYVSVVSYFGVIFLINISMFIVVLLQIKSLTSTRKKKWKELFLHDIKNTISLTFLLGLTWGFAFFAWDPVRTAFFYLFAIFNTLQGVFIFVFHCLIKESVRKHWRMYLCCGRCQLDSYSDWSRLSNVETKHNGNIHLSPASDSYESTRSNTTASTSNASSLSSFSRVEFYGRSYVNGGGIFINSAHTAPSDHVYPNNRRIITFLDLDTQ